MATLPFDRLVFRQIDHFNAWPFGRLAIRQFCRLDGLQLYSFANLPFGSLAACQFSRFEFQALITQVAKLSVIC